MQEVDTTPTGFATRCVHAGVDQDAQHKSATTPIYPTSTFGWNGLGDHGGYEYTRSGNPTRRALEENLAALEGGVDARAICSGMAAVTAALHLFKAGDHVIAGHDIYGGTWRLMADVMPQLGIEVDFVNQQEPGNVEAAIRSNTKGLWVETPSNPLLNCVDVAALVGIAKRHGLTSVADNTFLSPALFRPIEHGVDVVVHSTTKYLNGHSDVIGGAVVCGSREHAERVGFVVNAMGLGQAPFDAWLVLRGIKTLGPRVRQHCDNAMKVAQFLETHPEVERVYYPGLPTHPHHELARRQQDDFGGMVSFDLKGGLEKAKRVLPAAKLFLLAESLGGVESLWEHPWTMSHASMTESSRRNAGIGEGCVRVSVGIEDADDLISDLRQALSQ
jgi:cystathionine beta-lyase/cystathionine gamma-synthase